MAENKKASDDGATRTESGSVDETIKGAKGLDTDKGRVVTTVQSTTTSLPEESPASKEVGPSAPDTENEAPPLHTSQPDVPIAQTLAAGAGEHTPPDPEVFDSMGRPREVSGIRREDDRNKDVGKDDAK
jgi:hypothetical protein